MSNEVNTSGNTKQKPNREQKKTTKTTRMTKTRTTTRLMKEPLETRIT